MMVTIKQSSPSHLLEGGRYSVMYGTDLFVAQKKDYAALLLDVALLKHRV